jgi:hypothetical protein
MFGWLPRDIAGRLRFDRVADACRILESGSDSKVIVPPNVWSVFRKTRRS